MRGAWEVPGLNDATKINNFFEIDNNVLLKSTIIHRTSRRKE